MTEQQSRKAGNASPAVGLSFIAFGAYLLGGACFAIARGTWPWFMPPQFDVLAAVARLFFGSGIGGYAGGVLLGLVGLASVGFGVAVLVKRDV